MYKNHNFSLASFVTFFLSIFFVSSSSNDKTEFFHFFPLVCLLTARIQNVTLPSIFLITVSVSFRINNHVSIFFLPIILFLFSCSSIHRWFFVCVELLFIQALIFIRPNMWQVRKKDVTGSHEMYAWNVSPGNGVIIKNWILYSYSMIW